MVGGLFQPAHLLVLLVIVVLVLGPGRLTSLGRALGQSWRAFVAGFRSEATRADGPLLARACPRCGVYGADLASYCTRCGAQLR